MARDLSKSPQASKASAEKKLPQGASERRSRSTIVLRSIDRDEKKNQKQKRKENFSLSLTFINSPPRSTAMSVLAARARGARAARRRAATAARRSGRSREESAIILVEFFLSFLPSRKL